MALATSAAILAASTGSAVGGSLLYLLMGGGILGAVAVFAAVKMF